MLADLLDKKWYGGLYHLHNTQDTWNEWLEDFESSYRYPNDFREKLQAIFNDNLNHIKDKNVVDLACNLGYFSMAASSLGASRVLGIEIRQEYLDTFNRVYSNWPNKNITIEIGNLEDQFGYNKWLKEIDTILYTGHFYHTTKQDMILKEFTNSSAKCLILESINKNDYNQKLRFESIINPLNGYVDDKTEMIEVIAPTVEQTSQMLTNLGWSIKNICFVKSYNPERFVITAVR